MASGKIVSVNTEAAREKANEAGKRAAVAMSNKMASTGDAVKERATKAARAALEKLLDAGIKISQKQQMALEKLKTKYSDS